MLTHPTLSNIYRSPARLPCAPPQQANVNEALTAVLSFWLDLDNFLLGKLHDRLTLRLATVNKHLFQIENLCQNLRISNMKIDNNIIGNKSTFKNIAKRNLNVA